jgi:hypothetical protein
MLSGGVDWDSAVVATIPKVREARSTEQFASAIDTLLSVLRDPSTRVVRGRGGGAARQQPSRVAATWDADSTLIVTIPSSEPADSVVSALEPVRAPIRRAPRLVFDLRPRSGHADAGRGDAIFRRSGIDALLTPSGIAYPPVWERAYESFFNHFVRARIGLPLRGPTEDRPRQVAFLLGPCAAMPSIAWSLPERAMAPVRQGRRRRLDRTVRPASRHSLWKSPGPRRGSGLRSCCSRNEF